jgi:hypothetical protein
MIRVILSKFFPSLNSKKVAYKVPIGIESPLKTTLRKVFSNKIVLFVYVITGWHFLGYIIFTQAEKKAKSQGTSF